LAAAAAFQKAVQVETLSEGTGSPLTVSLAVK
jgi:hypothetical protein